MRILYLLYLLSIAIILPGALYAREYKGWTMTNFNNENGLPQNSISFAEMDNDGYLWLATQAGIVRYDGRRFRLFDNSNSALQHNRYLMLGKDSQGRIYGIDDALNTSFYDNRTGFSKPAALNNIAPAKDGGLLDFTRTNMGKLAPLTNKFTHSPYNDPGSFFYNSIGKGKGFILWNYYISGYVSNDKVHRTDTIDFHPATHMVIGCIGNKLCYIDKNRRFVLVDTNGVRTYQKIPFAISWSKLKENYLLLRFFPQQYQMLFNVDGIIYEVRLVGNRLQFYPFIDVRDIPDIAAVRYYPEKNLLVIGSNTKGLYLFKRQQLESVGKDDWQNENPFYALGPYGKDQVVATTGVLPGNLQLPGKNTVNNRFALLFDRNRHYWYSSGTDLLRTDEQFHVLKRIPLNAIYLVCMQEDAQGTVWLSQGPREFGRIQADTFQRYQLDSLEGKGIITINSFLPAGDHTFWLVGSRLCMWIDVKHHRQRTYHEFDNIELRTAYIDKKGNLWLGSYGQGYYLFRNGRFVKMPEDRTRALSYVHSFLEDDKGFIWMTTNNGLFQCAANDLYAYAAGKKIQIYHHYYGKESGLKTSEFNGGCTPSGLQLSNGRFAFPSMNGVVMFYPDSVQPWLPSSSIFIEQILLDGRPAQDGSLSKISPAFKRLELTVSSPYFGNPRNLLIQYNIAGLDDRWYPLDENGHIVLNTLKYGNYKLRIRKQSGFGPDNYVTKELSLSVLPFFYQTWWFRVLLIAGALLLVLVIIRIRYRYLLRRARLLETEVKDRTRELAYHNRLLEKLTLMIAHDLKSPLFFLSKITGHLRTNVQQQNLQAIDRTSGEIKNTADQVYQFIEGFNLWASSFGDGFSLNITYFKLDELMQELELFFKNMTEARNNKLLVTTGTSYQLHTDRELLKIIMRNIIDNANKHGRNCDIIISAAEAPGGQTCITIADNGQGMQEPVLKRIQSRIQQASTAASIERNSRLGYQMIIDFATRLGAKLDVQSEHEKGTSVRLYIQGKVIEEVRPSSDLAQQVVGNR